MSIIRGGSIHEAGGRDRVRQVQIPPEMAAIGTGTLVSPNITSHHDNGIGKWTEADIIKSVKTAQRPTAGLSSAR